MTRSILNGHLHDSADLKISEAAFQRSVTDLASYSGWKRYHTLRSKGSDAGWPDLVLCRPPELLIVELKAERGKLSDAQQEWLQALELSGVEVYVWRPSQWSDIERRLTAPRQRIPGLWRNSNSGEIHWTGTRLEKDEVDAK